MQPANVSYKVEEVREKKSRFTEIFLPIFLVVTTLTGVLVIGAISYLIGVEQGKTKSERTPPAVVSTTTPSPFIPTATKIIQPTSGIKTSPTVTPIPKTSVITSDKGVDGYVSSNGYTNTQSEIRVGRNKFLQSSGYLSFDLSKVPEHTKIVSATLRVYQVKTVGNPYSSETGTLKVDHLNYGLSLDESDYNAPALMSDFADLSKNRTSGWKEIDVTQRVIEDVESKRETNQYRLHFESTEKGTTDSGDYAYFESSDNSEGTTNVPQLLVKYY